MVEIGFLALFMYFAVLMSFTFTLIMIKGSAAKRLAFALAVAMGVYVLFHYFLLPAMWKYWLESQPHSTRIGFNLKGFSQLIS